MVAWDGMSGPLLCWILSEWIVRGKGNLEFREHRLAIFLSSASEERKQVSQ
jgi:hypothetical protein